MSMNLDRTAWLRDRRQAAEARMDTLWAPIYDEHWGAKIEPTHARFIKRFLKRCPPQAHLLDAACGTGKYWPLILAEGFSIAGIDQSQAMLNRAQAKFPAVSIEKIGLQELTFAAEFDCAICMDAMENVFPEDWLLVLNNLNRALKPGGLFYFTVEMAEAQETERAFRAAQKSGLPVVYGEWAHAGGYHFYPELAQVRQWVDEAGFDRLEETFGDSYQHYLVQKQR